MGKLVVAAAGILTLGALSSCSHENDDRSNSPGPPEDRGQVTIYSSLPLQGDSQPQSEDIVHAFELALEEHDNQAGGYDIEYVSLDDADPAVGYWTPELAAANAWRAANDPSTIAYLGEFNSGATAASLPILNYAGIPQVSPSNTYAGLTRPDGGERGEPDSYYPSGQRTYARVVPADHVQAAALLSDMVDHGCSSAFIVHDDETYGIGLADSVERGAADAGVDVVGRTTTERLVLDEVAAAQPDCLVHAGITQNGAVDVANDVGQALPDLQMFFPDGCAEAAFVQDLDEGVQDRVFITNPTVEPSDYPPAGQQFLDRFRTAYGHRAEPYAIYGYEAMSLVLDAIDSAGEDAAATDAGRAAVVDAIFATRDRESVLGTYAIDAYGDTTLTAYGGYVVADGELAFDHVIEPVVIEPTTGPEITDPPAPPTEEPSAPEETVSPIEGTWRGGEVTEDMVAAEWGRKAASFVFRANVAEEHLVTTLEVRGNQWQEFVSVDGGPDQPAQAGTFSVEDDRIYLDDGVASYEYRYALDGDTLRITLVESDSPPAAPGISDDVFQYAHNEATPFHKVG